MDFQNELIAEFDQELASTRRLLLAIPEDVDFAYSPAPKSMPLGRLTLHVTDTAGAWASKILTLDKLEFAADHKWDIQKATSRQALLERFDQQTAQSRADLAAMTPARWEQHWRLIVGDRTLVDESRYRVWRSWVVNHLVHHRAQLGVTLRLLGHPIPGMYGPSADDQKGA